MNLFRKLAGNIFFKIVLAFVALTFVLFGVSGFILGSSNSWVAKVGSTSISYSAFNKAMQADRDIILANNGQEEALKYLESEKFKGDVLGGLVNKLMMEKLRDEYGIYPSKKLILETVAKNQVFKKDGKFSHELFESFLKKNGLNEAKYVNAVSSDIVATTIMQSISWISVIDKKYIDEALSFKNEKRVADVVTISLRDIKTVNSPKEEEIEKFFAENKKNYVIPEMRKVSYIAFSKDDLVNGAKLTDAEIQAEYEKNKEKFQKPEVRNFYHILFENEDSAKAFVSKLGNDKAKFGEEFVKFAKETQKKDKKAITFNVAKKDLIPALANPTFALQIGDRSEVLQSPLGYHVFLLLDVKKAEAIPLAQVKETIRKQMMQGREDKVLQAKVSEIDDMILSSNSLVEVAKKYNLKISSNPLTINQNGQDQSGQMVKEIIELEEFVKNAFTLKKNQISKIVYANVSKKFYALKVEDVEVARQRELKEVKQQVLADLLISKRQLMMHELAQNVLKEVKENPQNVAQVAANHHVKFEKNKEFPRIYYIDYQGQKIPYQNQFLDELFAIKIGEATSVIAGGPQELVIGVLRNVKNVAPSKVEIEEAKKFEVGAFRREVVEEFKSYMFKKYPIKTNDKIIKGEQQ